MREVTYSEGVIIEDAGLMAALVIFCNNIWLPDVTVADHVQTALRESGHEAADSKLWEPRRKAVQKWQEDHKDLFTEEVIRRLPPNSPDDHAEHRQTDRKLEGPVYDRVCMRFHLIRGTIAPGLELFDDSHAKAQADLAKSIFYLDLPKIEAASPDQILSLRYEAQKAGVESFWGEIEEQTRLALAQDQNIAARGEKIREDFAKWNRGRRWVNTGFLMAGAMTTLAILAWGPEGLAAPLEALAAGGLLGFVPPWASEWHAQWIDYNRHRRKAFKCIARLDNVLRNPL